jgi:hypothetical protein
MLDSSRSAESSEGTTGVEHTTLSRVQSEQQPATVTEPKGEEALISLTQGNAPMHDSFMSRITRRRTVNNDLTYDTSEDVDRSRGRSKWHKMRRAASTLMVPKRRVGDAPTVMQSIRAIVCATCKWSILSPESTTLNRWRQRSQYPPRFHTHLGERPVYDLMKTRPLTESSCSGPFTLPSQTPTAIKTRSFSFVSDGGAL